MADSPELATKALESDAQDDNTAAQTSGIPGDSKPDQGAGSMGEHCVTDRPAPAGQTPTGEVAKYGEVEVYITKPADYPHQPSKLLLLLTGGTGIHSVNNQLQADRYAAEGFLVAMPDQFAGDPAPTSTTTLAADENMSVLEQVKLGMVNVAKSFTIDMWLARHTPEKVLPVLERVIVAVKEEFADAVESGGGVYAVGYCFGAKYVLLLGGEGSQDANAAKTAAAEEEGMVAHGPQIKVGAIAHGTQVTRDDIAGNRVPLTIVAVENDSLFPEDVLESGRQALKEQNVELEVQTYPKVPHGFAVLGDYDDTSIVEAQKEAFQQMLAWLKSH
ncbi:dienelactone hydrolase [Neohortaea acidophila]|uniref:Dienelactone hydrolase n=1 Tax=Neohortaea acidophila TaxID=245834 RepID=A0A6A6Q4S6_9PEZI|nr:dienelactone hydrolase [Neohortaea acidophila]KAF2487302.1 dienelactone hydrolase [Neohortaea acidophila]